MNKRDFLKTSGAIVAGSMISRFTPAQQQPAPRQNWAGNITYSTDHVLTPATADEVRSVVKSCNKLRALGSRHSFNRIADSTQNQISLEHLNQIDIDDRARTVTVGAGVRYGQLAPVIDARGFALHNLASLPHISVAGAIATATHGSGIHNGNLATAVRALEIVTANGDTLHLSRDNDGDQFLGAVVALGAARRRHTRHPRPPAHLPGRADRLSKPQLRSARAQPRCHLWQPATASASSLTGNITRPPRCGSSANSQPGEKHESAADFYGAKRATEKLHPITGHPAESCTEQQGIPGPWYERLPHFKMNFTPSSGGELQTEYFVPRDRGYEAILAVEKLRDQITPHLFVTELRTIAADDLWMSTAYKRDSLAIHFTWKPEWDTVKQILPRIEAQLKPFAPRPHWAKLFTIPPAQLQAQYTRLADFKQTIQHHDPKEKFRNAFIDTNLFTA